MNPSFNAKSSAKQNQYKYPKGKSRGLYKQILEYGYLIN